MLQYLKEGQGQAAKHYDVPLGTTTYCSIQRRTAQHYDVLLNTTTYCSALRRTAQHYDVQLSTTLFVTTGAASSFEFGPNFRWIFWTGPKVISKFYLGPKNHRKFGPAKVRDENSLGRNSGLPIYLLLVSKISAQKLFSISDSSLVSTRMV
jgi:hypothetical protein